MTVIKFDPSKKVKRDRPVKITLTWENDEIIIDGEYEYPGDAILLLELVKQEIIQESQD